MNKLQNKLLFIVMGVLLLISMVYVGREAVYFSAGGNANVWEETICVVIDAGHGGSK